MQDLVAVQAAPPSSKCVFFESVDIDNKPVYHTNVVMAVGTGVAVVCTEAIRPVERQAVVLSTLKSLGKEIIEITHQQMLNFCGNILEVSVYRSFTPTQVH